MKTFLLLISTVLIFNTLKSQKLKTYTTFDNNTFKQGDSILIGYYSGLSGFSCIKEYYYHSQYNKGYCPISNNLVGTKHKILNIHKDNDRLFDTSAYIVEVGEPGFLKGYTLYININQAIKNGEVILSLSPSYNPKQPIFNFKDSIAFLYKVKLSGKPFSDYALEFLYRFNNKIYEKYKQDEFELDNQKQLAIEKIGPSINQLSDTTTYFLDLKLNFGNYNFESSAFPVGGYDDYYLVLKSTWANYPETGIFFVNQREFANIQIDKNTANSFIKRRKNRHGEIDRNVFARVYFKNIVVARDSPLRSSFQDTKNRNFLFGSIYRIEFFDFENRKYNYIGQINPNL